MSFSSPRTVASTVMWAVLTHLRYRSQVVPGGPAAAVLLYPMPAPSRRVMARTLPSAHIPSTRVAMHEILPMASPQPATSDFWTCGPPACTARRAGATRSFGRASIGPDATFLSALFLDQTARNPHSRKLDCGVRAFRCDAGEEGPRPSRALAGSLFFSAQRRAWSGHIMPAKLSKLSTIQGSPQRPIGQSFLNGAPIRHFRMSGAWQEEAGAFARFLSCSSSRDPEGSSLYCSWVRSAGVIAKRLASFRKNHTLSR
ncbi:hypothetical protein Micbo1qcDRAFT_170795 [Microdochium bolleyi]|uniref:Uncharacterized protein n=1 Tax=Microdochium bolleyi TaxID=196109 RepID=A0A136JIS5_9PEZI|nr:hypothetical protein Micbo1qcDRAFT_170795 [Microdochium bolleyi]